MASTSETSRSSASASASASASTSTSGIRRSSDHQLPVSVIPPRLEHKYTIVFLHQLGQNSKFSARILRSLSFNNIKWIIPQAPYRRGRVSIAGKTQAWFNMGEPTNECNDAPYDDLQWFNMGPYSEIYGPQSIEGLDYSAKYVTNLLSGEPKNVKIGVGGFGIGFATALYTATCFALQKYGDGSSYNPNVKIEVICGINGWIPCPSFISEKFDEDEEAKKRAREMHISMSHEHRAIYVPVEQYTMSAVILRKVGFKPNFIDYYEGDNHHLTRKHMEDICKWINEIR